MNNRFSWNEGDVSVATADEDEKGYNPDQPRVPAGQPGGGQFGSGGGGSSSADGEAWKSGLTDPQVKAIDSWVTGGFTRIGEIREHERGERQSEAGKAFQEALDTAPNASGEIHRGIGGLEEDDINQFLTTGAEIEVEHSLSFSPKQELAEKFANKLTFEDEEFVVLKTVAGGSSDRVKDISAANRYGEREVIVRRGAKIRVERWESMELDGKHGYSVEVSLVD